jgi:GMP synthase-like glutamine amidotransferase
MGVYEEATHPWLAKEKHGIATAIGAGKKVLGICLGAQMIAEVLGARVYPHRHKEIGWHPVILTPDGIRSPWFRNFKGDEFTAFQWHGDTFDLPAGSIFLARGEACEHQAFSYGEHVLAMQFHIGSTAESIEKLIVHCREDLLPGPYVQPIHEIRNPPSGAYEDLKSSLSAVLEAFGEEVRVR